MDELTHFVMGILTGIITGIVLIFVILPSHRQIREEARFEFMCEAKKGKLYTTKNVRVCVLGGTEILLEQK